MGQPRVERWKQLQVNTNNVDDPTDFPSSSPPQFVLAPKAPTGRPTTGFLFMLKIAPGSFAQGPFSSGLWIRDPVQGVWGQCNDMGNGNLFNDGEILKVDVGPSELWFTPRGNGNDGLVILMVAEK